MTSKFDTSSLHDVLLRPVVSEKSYNRIDQGKYTFVVDPKTTKSQVKKAVEKVFGVKVTKVNTLNRIGKTYRTRFGTGKRKNIKHAIVTLAPGQMIDVFGSQG
ncbi:MAG: 50S ribosomal protein L23 [Bifidobacteriaceae bacterium]|jgi:large subunit ribosomal protein L23|nr:50S ribosomal protein L23 [Bifidobacteriaceae bacterium]